MIIGINRIYELIFVIEVHCVYCDVGIQLLLSFRYSLLEHRDKGVIFFYKDKVVSVLD
jgi:hypothetical protein